MVGNKLYAVGGYDGQAYLKTTEIFDPEFNQWYPGPEMPGTFFFFFLGAADGHTRGDACWLDSCLDVCIPVN